MERLMGQRVTLSANQVMLYPELLAKQVEISIAQCKQRVLDEGGTLGRVEGGEIIPGEFIEVIIYVETRFLTNEEDEPPTT